MKLRPYQEQAVSGILDEWSKVDKTLLVLPTGTGKTICFAKLAEKLVSEGKRILILAHRGELLDQAQEKIKQATGLGCSIEKADLTCLNSFYRIVVGSVQTLMTDKRLNNFKQDFFDVIVVDEAHHCLSKSYQNIFSYFKNAKVLGVTATPDRGDKRDLGEFFESIAFEYTLPEAIRDGFLAPIKALSIPINIDLNGCKQTTGDFNPSDVAEALKPFLFEIGNQMLEYCKNRKTVIFLPLIATSQAMTDILNNIGFKCCEVNGNSKDRKKILSDFEKNRYNVLCNSMLLTEGWDSPEVDCIICLRPTKIRALYAQIVGRGTRPLIGKTDLLLLDFLWHSDKHDLCHPASLVTDDSEMALAMTKIIAEQDGEVNISDIEKDAREQVIQSREEQLAKKLEAMRHKKRQLVDPVQFNLSIYDDNLLNYEPIFSKDKEKITNLQIKKLENMGIFPDDIKTYGLAESLIKKLDTRKTKGYTTPKQIRFLERHNFKKVGTWSFIEARSLIDRIASNHWRVPYDIIPNEYNPNKLINENNLFGWS